MDAAVLAGVVPGRLRIELVQHQLALSRGDAQTGFSCSVPQRSDTTAQRAVAFHDVVEPRLELERDPTAVARTPVFGPRRHRAAFPPNFSLHRFSVSQISSGELLKWLGNAPSAPETADASFLPVSI